MHGACLLRGQCSRASIPRLSFGGHEKQLSRAYGAALRVAGGGAAPSGVRAEALRVAGGGAAPSGVRAEEETALWEDPLMTAAQSLFFSVSRDRREFRGFGLNCEEMCARPGMRRGLI